MVNLIVRNFGTIDECRLEIRKFTVFVGPQGSGKSTIARLYVALSWIEKALRRGSLDRTDLDASRFRSILAYVQLDNLLCDDTEIKYAGETLSLKYIDGKLRLRMRSEFHYSLPKILYIPSERSYLCLSDEILSMSNLPTQLYELASDYSAARSMFGLQGFDLPINDFHFSYSKSDSSSLISDKAGTYAVRLSRAASGIQSVLPLALVFEYYVNHLMYKEQKGRSVLSVQQMAAIRDICSRYSCSAVMKNQDRFANILKAAGVDRIPSSDEEKDKMMREIALVADFRLAAIIEEPEQNLFPLAQKSLVEYLVRGTLRSEGSSLLMTTHSPYVLASLNNLIYAGEHGNIEGVDQVVDKDVQIKCSNISANFFHDGVCESIIDKALCNIDPKAIDSCSYEINRIYEALENIVYGLQ